MYIFARRRILLLLGVVTSLIIYPDAFPLRIHNMDVLLYRQHDHELSLSIDLASKNILEVDLHNASISLLRDGVLCHAFEEKLSGVNILLPAACTSEQAFWFSVVVLIKEKHMSSIPIYIPPIVNVSNSETLSSVTLVMPLALDDIPRASVLLESLIHFNSHIVNEFLIFVPEHDLALIKALLHDLSQALQFPVHIHSEDILLPVSHSMAYPYAKQMAIKLLAARMVHTPHYMTLDADIISLRDVSVSDLIDVRGRSKYDHEARYVHETWWDGSESFLHISSSAALQEKQGFGVTPALLSTYGSMLLLARIEQLYGSDGSGTSSVSYWITSLGRNGVLWSEYTLYRTVLDYYHLFDELHFEAEGGSNIHCFDVWYAYQLPWDVTSAKRSRCLFSVVQSSTGLSASTLHAQLQSV